MKKYLSVHFLLSCRPKKAKNPVLSEKWKFCTFFAITFERIEQFQIWKKSHSTQFLLYQKTYNSWYVSLIKSGDKLKKWFWVYFADPLPSLGTATSGRDVFLKKTLMVIHCQKIRKKLIKFDEIREFEFRAIIYGPPVM